jgi:hypothetical protein
MEMGFRRAFDRAVGRAPVSASTRIAILALAASLSGCSVIGDISGAVAAIATGAATANPIVGIGVGVAVKAGMDTAGKHVSRSRKRNEHDAIAAAVAEAGVGETRPWSVDQRVTGDAHGEVRVVRVIESSLAVCKEVVFSVVETSDEPASPAWFWTTVCRDGARWTWAAAEPAVDRWLTLQ